MCKHKNTQPIETFMGHVLAVAAPNQAIQQKCANILYQDLRAVFFSCTASTSFSTWTDPSSYSFITHTRSTKHLFRKVISQASCFLFASLSEKCHQTSTPLKTPHVHMFAVCYQ